MEGEVGGKVRKRESEVRKREGRRDGRRLKEVEGNQLTRFSLTMPSLAAKNASTCLMKCCSCGFSLSQSARSFERSTSSAVQNEAEQGVGEEEIQVSDEEKRGEGEKEGGRGG